MVGKSAVKAHFANHRGSGWGDHYGPCEEDLNENGEISLRAEICTVYAEISWPIDVPYARRHKVTYQIEVAKPMTVLRTAETVAQTKTKTQEKEDDEEKAKEKDDEKESEKEKEEEEVTKDDDDNELFEILDGEVVVNDRVRTTIKSLGCALVSGGKDMPVTCRLPVDGKEIEPFGDADDPSKGNINDHRQHSFDAGILDGGVAITVQGISWSRHGSDYSKYIDRKSNPANSSVLVLKDGDAVPDIKGFDGQANLETFIKDYIDADSKKVSLKPNEAIFLFELGTTNLSSSAADFQDMVILVNMTPVE